MAWILQECTSSITPAPARVYGGGSVGWVNDLSQAQTFASEAAADAYALLYRMCADAVNTVQQTQTFLVSGNFTVPNNVTVLDSVECWGSSAGGTTSNATDGRGGGGGGAYAKNVNVPVTPGAALPIIVGTAVAADTAGELSDLLAPSTTLARGGSVGIGTAGGIGGLVATSVGTVKFAGGNGGAGGTGIQGGGGGSSAGTAANGNNGSNGAAGAGGAGGTAPTGGSAGGTGGNAAAGAAGVIPGSGGGGGGVGTKAGGAGGAGKVIVTWTAP